MSDGLFIKGIFKEELKNRFLCLVEIENTDTLCYIPSSCRLSNFVDLTGKTVLLKPIAAPNSRTSYSVYALQVGGKFVLLNMSQSNRIVEDALGGRKFSFLGKRKRIKREYLVEGYKCDLFIEETKTIIEIKSILSFQCEAQFPSVFSQRAIDQLKHLIELLRKGYKVVYIFVSMNNGVKKISINETVDEYYHLFSECVGMGMLLKGYSIILNGQHPEIDKHIEVKV